MERSVYVKKKSKKKKKAVDAIGISTAATWKEASCALASLWLVTDR